MYLMVTKNPYMCGLTKYLKVEVPHNRSEPGGNPVTVTEVAWFEAYASTKPFTLPGTGRSHVFSVMVVHGDVSGLHIPCESIQQSTAYNLSHASTYADVIQYEVEIYLEQCRIKEQAEHDSTARNL